LDAVVKSTCIKKEYMQLFVFQPHQDMTVAKKRQPEVVGETLEELVKRVLDKGSKFCDRQARGVLASAAADGRLDAAGGSSLVFVIDETTCKPASTFNKCKTAVVFCCSLCDYIGDRLYHSQKHFERIHQNAGKPIMRKRKYGSPPQLPPRKRASRVSQASQAEKQQASPKKAAQEGRYLDAKIAQGASFAYMGDLFEGAARWNEIQERLHWFTPAPNLNEADSFLNTDDW
jgi:hypothetical protein